MEILCSTLLMSEIYFVEKINYLKRFFIKMVLQALLLFLPYSKIFVQDFICANKITPKII